MRYILLLLLAVGMALFLWVACDPAPSSTSCIPNNYSARYSNISSQTFKIPANITDLYSIMKLPNATQLINRSSNRVLLVVIGGPLLAPVSTVTSGRFTPSAYSVLKDNFTVYVVYQMNYIYANQISDLTSDASADNRFTPSLAEELNDQNAEILFRVAHHFEKQQKEVSVLAPSYGSILYNNFLRRYPTENCVITRAISAVGRLRPSPNLLATYKAGNFSYFAVNSAGTQVVDVVDSNSYSPFLGYMIGDIIEVDYTQLLSANIRHAVLFLVSPQDRNVGPMDSTERTFINNHSQLDYTQIDVSADLRRISRACPHNLGFQPQNTVRRIVDYLLDGSTDAEVRYTASNCP